MDAEAEAVNEQREVRSVEQNPFGPTASLCGAGSRSRSRERSPKGPRSRSLPRVKTPKLDLNAVKSAQATKIVEETDGNWSAGARFRRPSASSILPQARKEAEAGQRPHTTPAPGARVSTRSVDQNPFGPVPAGGDGTAASDEERPVLRPRTPSLPQLDLRGVRLEPLPQPLRIWSADSRRPRPRTSPSCVDASRVVKSVEQNPFTSPRMSDGNSSQAASPRRHSSPASGRLEIDGSVKTADGKENDVLGTWSAEGGSRRPGAESPERTLEPSIDVLSSSLARAAANSVDSAILSWSGGMLGMPALEGTHQEMEGTAPAGSGPGSAELPPLPHKGRSMRGHDRYWSGTLGQDSSQDKQFSGPYAARPRSRHRKVARKRWKPKVSCI